MAEKDIISKDLFKQIAVDLANIFSGFNITAQDQLTMLDTEHQRIQDRRADLVLKVSPKDKKPYIIHIEIQNNPHAQMHYRMLSYYLDISLKYINTPIYQYVIYIGKATGKMQSQLKQDQLNYQYCLLDIRDIKCETLMNQGTADALVLAILCDFGGKEPQNVINSIVQRLSNHCGDNESDYRRYLMMLEILADNRGFKEHIKEAEAMITQVQLENLPSYEIGLEKGVVQGLERGRALEQAETARVKAEAARNKAETNFITSLKLYEHLVCF